MPVKNYIAFFPPPLYAVGEFNEPDSVFNPFKTIFHHSSIILESFKKRAVFSDEAPPSESFVPASPALPRSKNSHPFSIKEPDESQGDYFSEYSFSGVAKMEGKSLKDGAQ